MGIYLLVHNNENCRSLNMASLRVPLFLYAGCITSAANPANPAPLCKSVRGKVDKYVTAQNRAQSYYALPLDSVLDVDAPSPKDTNQLEWRNLKMMEVGGTIESHGQIYHPTAWIRRHKKWVPFEFVNLGLWEAASWTTDELRSVAKGFLLGVASLIEDTPLE